ncbi:hypothetical protein [Streptomyces pratensis]
MGPALDAERDASSEVDREQFVGAHAATRLHMAAARGVGRADD